MNSVIGFTAIYRGSEIRQDAAMRAQRRALSHFPHLKSDSYVIGETALHFWGHGSISSRIHSFPDGSMAALIGSPQGDVSWSAIQECLLTISSSEKFRPDWDGRYILLHIDPAGVQWTMWSDWLGSIPVYHALQKESRIASTLEPAVVAGLGLTAEEISIPALIYMFINGHYIFDWTLYENMTVAPPDSVCRWDNHGFSSQQLYTIVPTQARWETPWDELIDEMYELTYEAVASVLKTESSWILPLSAGLDSRLIAGVAADLGTDVHTYSWGSSEATDVVYAEKIARALNLPWQHIPAGYNFLAEFTPAWADLFGSSMHFHGMYQMAFMDSIKHGPDGPVVSGFIGDSLSGDDLKDIDEAYKLNLSCQLYQDWYIHWQLDEIESLLLSPVGEAAAHIGAKCQRQLESIPGAWFQRLIILGLWSRQRFFTYFQSMVADYWRGVGTPFINRNYAQFCFSLPRAALDDRRLLLDVYKRYYGLLATIPGTYGPEPLIRTGSYLVKKRLASTLPRAFWPRTLKELSFEPLRIDSDCLMATGKESLWPIWQVWDQLGQIIDLDLVESTYEAAMTDRSDIQPLRKLQSVQTLAYSLLNGSGWSEQ